MTEPGKPGVDPGSPAERLAVMRSSDGVPSTPAATSHLHEAFRRQLRDHGYVGVLLQADLVIQ